MKATLSDSMIIMDRMYYRSICLVLLLFYCTSSLSPRYVSVAGVAGEGGINTVTQEKSVGYGIIWLKVVVNKLLHGFRADAVASEKQFTPQAAAAEDLYLIKKKRAIYRERFDIAPPLHAEKLPPHHGDDLEPLFNSYDVFHDPLRRQVDGYYCLRTGLSPPLFLS